MRTKNTDHGYQQAGEPCSACGQQIGYNAPVIDSEGEDDVDSYLHGEDSAMFKQISFESQVAKLKLKVHKAELLVHECKLDMHRVEVLLKDNLNDLLQLELGKRIFDLQASAVRKREQDGAPKKPVCCGCNEDASARIVQLSFEEQFDQRKLRVSNAEYTVKQATLEVDDAELELKKLLSKLTQLELNKSKSDHQANAELDVIDGQHRLLAAQQLLPQLEVPVVLVSSSTYTNPEISELGKSIKSDN
jgi:hypothetical protein